jgi:WG containing repeat
LFRWALLVAFAVTGVCRARTGKELLVVVQNGKYGYIDQAGKVVIPPQFEWAEDFWRGLGTVYVCGRYVSIDSSATLLPLRIAADGQLTPKKQGDKFGFVDSLGHFKIPPSFDEVLPFSEGLAAVRTGEKWGFIDASGQFAIQPRFKAAYYFREGVGTAELESDDPAKSSQTSSNLQTLSRTVGSPLAATKNRATWISQER